MAKQRSDGEPLCAGRPGLRRACPRGSRVDESGFTLIELIVVVAILPLILGGIATALISVFSLQDSVSNRVGDSNDALVASTDFNRDVQSAEQLTTESSPAACGSLASNQTQLLALEWAANTSAPGDYDTVVSYISTRTVDAQPNTTTYSLTRQQCSFGTSTTPNSTTVLAHDIGSTPTVTVYGAKNASGQFANITSDFTSWYSTLGVTQVALGVQGSQTASGYSYNLVGLPGQSKSQSSGSTLTPSSSGPYCGFATPNSQSIYANSLCFADFTNYNYTSASTGTCQPSGQPAQVGQLFQLPITNTPYTLSFCLQVSANVVQPSVIPTYYNPSGDDSEAFLGNNGFYTGVPGEPALYENSSGQYVVMTFTDVQVLEASGSPASGWTLVTGDAESTDTNEWINFSNTTGAGLDWSILPNDPPSDLWGNACYDDQDANNSGALAWTGAVPATTNAVGTPSNGAPASSAALTVGSNYATGVSSILCESDQQLNKTGTLMVQAQEPTGSSASQSLVISAKGAGLEAIFVGVLL